VGGVLASVGRVAEGEAHILRAIELYPDHARAWFNLGVLRFEDYRYADAVPCFERALKLQRPYPMAVANLAAALNGLQRFPEAVRLLRGAADEIHGNAIARAQFAIALVETGDVTGARRELDVVRRLSPQTAEDLQAYFQSKGVPIR
jgi:tetratricopeptide (TPR) repeat protein